MWPKERGRSEIDENEAYVEITKPKAQPTITRSLNTVSNRAPILNIATIMDCKRYSTKTKLLRVTALVKRFIDNARGRRSASVELTAEDLRAAEKLWIKSIQPNSFVEEEKYLLGVNKKESMLVKHLGLFQDQEDTIRCQCRID